MSFISHFTPFLLMWPRRKMKLSFSQVCRSVLFSAPYPDFVWVNLPYLVRWVSNHFFTVLTGKFLVAASCSQRLSFFCLSLKLSLVLPYSSSCYLTNSTMASSSESLRKMDFIWPFFCLDWVDSTSVSVSVCTLFSPLSGLSSPSLHPLSVPLLLFNPLSLLLLSISSAVSLNSNCGWVSPVGTSIILLLPLGMMINQSINCTACLIKNSQKPHRTDFTPNQSSLAQYLS